MQILLLRSYEMGVDRVTTGKMRVIHTMRLDKMNSFCLVLATRA